ncbi:MAG: holo-ACP synthase [Paenibacillaceae bacterium]
MIRGIGTDIVEIDRIRLILLNESADRFLTRVLTPAERAHADKRGGRLYEYIAGRFAAKEAVSKALGCGIGQRLGFQDIEILPNAAGKPLCKISKRSRNLAKCGDNTNFHLSITHSSKMASAFVVWEELEI